ncbi:hypothetical protein OAR19_00065 [bacterium]|nr:hypothetical protein [bacterium]
MLNTKFATSPNGSLARQYQFKPGEEVLFIDYFDYRTASNPDTIKVKVGYISSFDGNLARINNLEYPVAISYIGKNLEEIEKIIKTHFI